MHNKSISVYTPERHQIEQADKRRQLKEAREQFEALFNSDYERADKPLNLEEKSDQASRRHPKGCNLERAIKKP